MSSSNSFSQSCQLRSCWFSGSFGEHIAVAPVCCLEILRLNRTGPQRSLRCRKEGPQGGRLPLLCLCGCSPWPRLPSWTSPLGHCRLRPALAHWVPGLGPSLVTGPPLVPTDTSAWLLTGFLSLRHWTCPHSPPPRPRKAVRSLALATATLTVSRGSSRALISSRAWLGSCPCCSGVSKSRPACRLVLFGSALSVCSFRAMLSNKEQVAVYTQGRRSWPRDSPSASSRFFPRPLDVHTIVPVIRGAGRAHAHKLGCSGEETAKPRALGQRALVPRPLFQAAEQKHPR